MIKQQLLNDVETVIRNQIEEQRNSGGGKTSWFERGDFEKVKGSLLADMTLMMVLDGVTKEWTLRHAIAAGQHFSCLLFAEIVSRKNRAAG